LIREGGIGGFGGNNANGGGLNGNGGSITQYSVNVGASAFEIDLFGRIRSQSTAALNSYFATEAAARAVRLTLVADIADAYLTLATDRTLLGIAQDTVRSAERSVTLTRARLAGGVAPRTDLRQAETVLATAQSDAANLTTLVAQDRNALDLLVGAPVASGDLPPSIEAVESAIAPVPAGLDSSILLRRPDVIEAEFRLRSANAQIGAARAAFFPRISLTSLGGFASTALGSLFAGGAFNYSVAPGVALPLFDGGANRGNLALARAQFEAATATYQRTIQAAFRDVADALARRATIADQAGAQTRLKSAAQDTARLTDARYRGGVASFLESLDAQRSLYGARRSLASTRLVRARNLVDLYRAVGGDPTLS
jgi:multidrug efflux system outer membrane protein